MLDRLATQQCVKVRIEIVTIARQAMAEVAEEGAQLSDAGFVVVELGVNLEPSARLQHYRFFDGGVIAQCDQGFDYASRGKSVAFAHLHRCRVMREP